MEKFRSKKWFMKKKIIWKEKEKHPLKTFKKEIKQTTVQYEKQPKTSLCKTKNKHNISYNNNKKITTKTMKKLQYK